MATNTPPASARAAAAAAAVAAERAARVEAHPGLRAGETLWQLADGAGHLLVAEHAAEREDGFLDLHFDAAFVDPGTLEAAAAPLQRHTVSVPLAMLEERPALLEESLAEGRARSVVLGRRRRALDEALRAVPSAAAANARFRRAPRQTPDTKES